MPCCGLPKSAYASRYWSLARLVRSTIFCWIFFYWSVQLWLKMRFYVVTLTTGIWYYRTSSLASQEGDVDMSGSALGERAITE